MARILVIDDEESIRYTFANFISGEGHDVVTAGSYAEGISHIAAGDFDLIITDIILGGRTGIDLLREVRERKLVCPVVVITGYPTMESAAEAVRLGAFDYLRKPVEQEDVLRVTRLALAHKKVLDENFELTQALNLRASMLEQANLRLNEMNRLKSMFIASMSHELRTPLNSIIGFSSIILDEWLGPINEEQKENLNTVLKAGNHLLALINDVIDVSKIEAGMIDSYIEEFDVYDLIGEAVAAVEKEMRDKGLDLRLDNAHAQMRTDRRRLLQCVLNLLSNAAKFSEQGYVHLRAQRVEVGTEEKALADMIEITVADSGIGIREEDMAKLFNPFIRLDSPLKARVTGTGLGLYLTRKLVMEILHGEITAESRYGEGSRFVLTIPVNIG